MDPKLVTIQREAAEYKADPDQWIFTHPERDRWIGSIESEKTGGIGRYADPVKVVAYAAEAIDAAGICHERVFDVAGYPSARAALAAAKKWVIATACAHV